MALGVAEGIVRLGGTGALAEVRGAQANAGRTARDGGGKAERGGADARGEGVMAARRTRQPASRRASVLDAAAAGGTAALAVADGGRVPAEGSEPGAVGVDASRGLDAGNIERGTGDAARQRRRSAKVPAETCGAYAAASSAGLVAMIDTAAGKRKAERALDRAGSVLAEESELGAQVNAAVLPRAGAVEGACAMGAAMRQPRRSTRVPAGHRDKQAVGAAGRVVTGGDGNADRALDDAGFAAAGDDPAPRAGARGVRGVELIAGHSTRLRQLRFAKVLAETCNVALAAASAGRTVATVHRWRSVDAAFAAAWDEALAIGYDRLENALLVYALGKVDGVAGGAAGGSISNGDLQLAVGMLQRHRASSGGRRGDALPIRMPSEAETDAALKRALDGLARRGKRS